MQPLTKQFAFCALFLWLGCSGAPIQPPTPVPFYTKLRTNKTTIVLDVFFHNSTTKSMTVGFGFWECSFGYRIQVGNKIHIDPPRQPTALPKQPRFERTCPAMLYTRTIKKNSSVRLQELRLPLSLVQALRAAKMKYSGEFRFSHQVNQEPFRLEIYKIP
jgi:hypothetical protein